MKNYLLELKSKLLKKKKILDEVKLEPQVEEKVAVSEETIIKNIADSLDLELVKHDLVKISNGKSFVNSFSVGEDNNIYFFPPNSGMPICPFEFYKGSKYIISNKKGFFEIKNLDDILIQMVRLFDRGLDEGLVFDPYYFMLRLDEGKNATLLITDKAIRNHKLNEDNFLEATKHFINDFLDHFMGWNFGVSINRNETLKEELEVLNNKVIDLGLRKWAGSGIDVFGNDKDVFRHIQHYYLPVDKQAVLKKANKQNS